MYFSLEKNVFVSLVYHTDTKTPHLISVENLVRAKNSKEQLIILKLHPEHIVIFRKNTLVQWKFVTTVRVFCVQALVLSSQ